MTVTHDMLHKAYDLERAAKRATTLLSLRFIAQRAREFNPDAATVRFEWSDQGEFLQALDVLDAAGQPLGEVWSFDAEADWNLSENVAGQWLPHMTDDDGQPTDSTGLNCYRLDVDRALAIPLPGMIEVIHHRDPDMDCGVEVYVAGKRIPADVEDIDPGRGHRWAGGWKSRLLEAQADAVAQPENEYLVGLYQGLLGASESKYVEDKPADWREQVING